MIEISIWWIPFIGILFFWLLAGLTEDTGFGEYVVKPIGGLWLLISLIIYIIKAIVWIFTHVRIVV